jgi:hypothetical protein
VGYPMRALLALALLCSGALLLSMAAGAIVAYLAMRPRRV